MCDRKAPYPHHSTTIPYRVCSLRSTTSRYIPQLTLGNSLLTVPHPSGLYTPVPVQPFNHGFSSNNRVTPSGVERLVVGN